MPWASYLNPADLPPRPDPQTGLPRPPRAPRFSGSNVAKEVDTDRNTILADKSSPPPGQGPVLAWYKSSKSGMIKMAVGVPPLMAGIFTVGSGFSVDWMRYWWAWLLIALATAGVYHSVRVEECSVGAEWLKLRKSWVRIYELTKVTAHGYSNDVHLHITDADGRKVEAGFLLLQRDRDIWDLVYNGILHSVIAGGAQTNGLLHRAISLPYPK